MSIICLSSSFWNLSKVHGMIYNDQCQSFFWLWIFWTLYRQYRRHFLIRAENEHDIGGIQNTHSAGRAERDIWNNQWYCSCTNAKRGYWHCEFCDIVKSIRVTMHSLLIAIAHDPLSSRSHSIWKKERAYLHFPGQVLVSALRQDLRIIGILRIVVASPVDPLALIWSRYYFLHCSWSASRPQNISIQHSCLRIIIKAYWSSRKQRPTWVIFLA